MIPDALGVAKSQTAVLEYETGDAADSAVSGLNNVSLGEFKLSLQRVPKQMATLLLQPASTMTEIVEEKKKQTESLQPTTALQLENMVSHEDLNDDELYAELLEDVSDECNSHGAVRSVIIPRATDTSGDQNFGEAGNWGITISLLHLLHRFVLQVLVKFSFSLLIKKVR